MGKFRLKVGDNVELWNGDKGEITDLKYPYVIISNKNSFIQETHFVNLKLINDILVEDARDIRFK